MRTGESYKNDHLHDELKSNSERVVVETKNGPVTGGRAANGAAVFLEIPYALPPKRFQDPEPLPKDFKYEDKEYIRESAYGVQPHNDGQARGMPFEDKVGFGEPTENPLFLNIVCPPSFPNSSGDRKFPVGVYIHGGFLQFGSPHGLKGQAQYVAADRSEVWVNIGYRLSAFGFLACDEPYLGGNYGFKDQWLALEWIKDNIEVFGGDPNDIRLTGLSAGAHSVHQLLHHASRLPEGKKAPFHRAELQSNAILNNPKTPTEYKFQFRALCQAVGLDPDAPDILTTLRDPEKIPASSITRIIDSEVLGKHGTFRGCLDGHWLASSPDPMTWQRNGGFANALLAHGVRSVVVGDLTEEWYLYSIAHPIASAVDVAPNLERYFPPDVVKSLMQRWRDKGGMSSKSANSTEERTFGEILSCGQVHLPVRLLVRDLRAAGFPVLRYEIRWAPQKSLVEGYVTHGADRALWAFRVPTLERDEADIARTWLGCVQKEREELERNPSRSRDVKSVLALKEDRTIGWITDERWDEFMSYKDVLPDERG